MTEQEQSMRILITLRQYINDNILFIVINFADDENITQRTYKIGFKS